MELCIAQANSLIHLYLDVKETNPNIFPLIFGTELIINLIYRHIIIELVFEDCKIPKENLLGEIGKGFKMALATLDGGRIGVAARALVIAQSALDHCVKYVTENIRAEKRISQYQFTQFELADMQARVDAAKLLVYRAAQAKQEHEPYGHFAAMGKLYAAEAATDVTRRCMQLVGYEGYTRNLPFERLMRDAKITEIYEGTSEVQRMVISSWMGVK